MIKYTENLCVNGSPIGSTSPYGQGAEKAFDGYESTYRASSESGDGVNGVSWIGYTFNEPKRIEKIYYYQSDTHAVTSIKIQGSNDRSTWFDIYVAEVSPLDQFIVFSNKERFLHWRLLANSPTINGSNWRVHEIEMYEAIYIDKFLLSVDNKPLSIRFVDTLYNLEMLSNETPMPFKATSSSEQDGYEAYKAFNSLSSSNDCWMAISDTPATWIQIDFGVPMLVNKMLLKSRNSESADIESPKNFQILGSNDGENFNILLEVDGEDNWVKNEIRIYMFDNNVEYRYYRLNIINNNEGSYVSIGQIIYGLEEVRAVYLENNEEEFFLTQGIEKGTEVDLHVKIKKNDYVVRSSEPLGDGKLFKHKIYVTSIPINGVLIN